MQNLKNYQTASDSFSHLNDAKHILTAGIVDQLRYTLGMHVSYFFFPSVFTLVGSFNAELRVWIASGMCRPCVVLRYTASLLVWGGVEGVFWQTRFIFAGRDIVFLSNRA